MANSQASAFELGRKLRSLRTGVGMTSYELGEMCGMSQSKVVKIENARSTPKIADIEQMCSALGVSTNVAQSLVEDCLSIRAGRLNPNKRTSGTRWRSAQREQRECLDAELDARVNRIVAGFGLPAWLQTPDYAAHMHKIVNHPSAVDEFVHLRMRRQAETFSKHREYACLIDEAILHRASLPPLLWIEQLDYVKQQIRRGAVRVGILPLGMQSSARIQPLQMVDDSFVLYDLWLVGANKMVYQGDPATVAAHVRQFEELERGALWEADAHTLVEEIERRVMRINLTV